MKRGIYILIVAILISITIYQQINLNKYNHWISDDLNDDLAAIGIGINQNTEVLNDIVDQQQLTETQVNELESNYGKIYRMTNLFEFAIRFMGFDSQDFNYTKQSSPWKFASNLSDEAEYMFTSKSNSNEKITLTEEELTIFEGALELHTAWQELVKDYYPKINSEGAHMHFYDDHDGMKKDDDWINFLQDLVDETEEYNLFGVRSE
ncbi:hypothetical protein [Aquisalibacillus elongatus]|uniref:hypothetical protein n=1 Tax=Aquisalibacillus elongatus TaxID=485577 RepID=UPI001474F5A0|nr:hypothetical protein [Aquisalibacillus elongatus]